VAGAGGDRLPRRQAGEALLQRAGVPDGYLTLFPPPLRPAGSDRRAPDEDERLRLFRLHWRDAVKAVETGLIEDAKSVSGILLVARRLESGLPSHPDLQARR
jgi:hypothetical protein